MHDLVLFFTMAVFGIEIDEDDVGNWYDRLNCFIHFRLDGADCW